MKDEGVLSSYANIQNLQVAIQTIHVLQKQINNKLLTDETPALEALIQSVIDHQKVRIDAIKFVKAELQQVATQLVTDNEKSKKELGQLKSFLQKRTEKEFSSAEFVPIRSSIMGKIAIQLSWIEQKLKDITVCLQHNKPHAKNSDAILGKLAAPEVGVETLKALMEEYKEHDPKKTKTDAEKAIDSAIEKLGRINTILGEIQYS